MERAVKSRSAATLDGSRNGTSFGKAVPRAQPGDWCSTIAADAGPPIERGTERCPERSGGNDERRDQTSILTQGRYLL